MTYGSVCSGIEAASVAWHPLGWQAAWLSEIEPLPCAVLKHHYPSVPNLGDMTGIAARVRDGSVEAPDILVGGTPCQAFSVAGLRDGLSDPRGALTLAYVDLANAIDATRLLRGMPLAVIFWENVPGVLTSKDNAFGCFLAGLAGESCELKPPGGKWPNAGCVFGPQRTVAWRVLDAQYFGVAQRRRRVFVVASARDRFNPAEVLFKFEGVRRDSPPRREAGQGAAGDAGRGATSADGRLASKHNSHWNGGVHPPLSQASQSRGGGIGASNQEIFEQGGAGLVPHPPLAPIAFSAKDYGADASEDISPTLRAGGHTTSHANAGVMPAVAIDIRNSKIESGGPTMSIQAGGISEARGMCINALPHTMTSMRVRRLTPIECERLQGFPDDWTLVPHRSKTAADGPRYKAIGNSMAVPVMRWIGRRIQILAMR